MLLYSMSLSVDGFVSDREGSLDWSSPSDELFEFHLERVRKLGLYICGRKLYEAMRVWETDPAMRETELKAAFADTWSELPKVVFSRTLTSVEGKARLAKSTLAEEVAAAQADERDVEIGGATLAGQAFELGLIDELSIFRHPVVIGGGAAFLPPVTEAVPLQLRESRTFDSGVVLERYRRSA